MRCDPTELFILGNDLVNDLKTNVTLIETKLSGADERVTMFGDTIVEVGSRIVQFRFEEEVGE